MIVDAFHPAPARFVPRRGRNLQAAVVTCRSPVEIPEEDLSRSVEVESPYHPGRREDGASMRLLDGRLWLPVLAQEAVDPPGQGRYGRTTYGKAREATLAEFTDWIAGKGAGALSDKFTERFSGTPLVARSVDPKLTPSVLSRGPSTRGDGIDLAAAREVAFDGRERAAADLARYVAEDIRIIGGRPFVRAVPLLLVEGVTGAIKHEVATGAYPWHAGFRTLPATRGTLEDCIAVQGSLGVAPADEAQEAVRRRWTELVPPGALAEDDDLRWSLNAFAEPMRRTLDLAIEAAYGQKAERLKAAREALLPVEIAAMTGTAHYDVEAAVMAMRGALKAWLPRPGGTHGQEYLAAFIEAVAIPRLDARAQADLALMPSP